MAYSPTNDRAHAAIATGPCGDEPPHQGSVTRTDQGIAEGIDPDMDIDHGRVTVHDLANGAVGIESVTERPGDLEQKGIAFNQTNRPVVVDDRYDQCVRLIFKPCENVSRDRVRRHRFGILGKNFNRRHIGRYSIQENRHA